jgi:hypothetical protein
MSTSRSLSAAAAPAAASVPAPGLVAAWVRFWFTPVDPVGLHVLRVLSGMLFLVWLLPLAGQVEGFFGLAGWFDTAAYKDTSRLPELPPHLFSWSLTYACGTDPVPLKIVYWLSIAVITLFTLGLTTRLTGVLTWVAVLSFTANPAIAYDSDPFFQMLAFYLMVGYLLLGQRRPGVSWVERLLGPWGTWLFRRAPAGERGPESVGANLAVRLLQVHFALAVLASGLQKLQVSEWWSGLALWFYLHPAFGTMLGEVRSSRGNAGTYLSLLSLAAYLTLAWQIAFPAFAWRKRARWLLLGGAAVAFLADALLLRLPLLGPIMVIGCLSYVTPAEWRWLTDLLAKLPGVRALWAQPAPDTSRRPGPAAKSSGIPVGHRG